MIAVDDFKVGEGIDASLVGETDLANGEMIVTYNQMPLYYWVGDVEPGDTNGQAVNDVWYVVSADGKVVKGMMVEEKEKDKDDYEYEY